MTSIIVPIYNAAPYLRQCLDSLLSQTVTDWEAILVDDASGDESARIAEEYVARDARIHLLQQPVNRGQSAARNRGLAEARGEYIAFLDSDDWWDQEYIEQHLAAIDGYDMVQSGYRRVASIPPLRGTLSPSRGKEKLPKHRWQFTSACMRLYRREAIEGLRFEEGTFYEDVLWTVDLLLRNPKIQMTKYIGYNYRLNPQSTTSKPRTQDQKRVMEILRQKQSRGIVLYTRLKLKLYWALRNGHLV